MKEIICYTTLLPEGVQRSVTFFELLLNDNWANGGIECPESCFNEVGDFNQKLDAKRNYEFLLRAAFKYPLRAVGKTNVPSAEDGNTVDLPWESYRTDCYIVGKYQQELSAAGYLETVIEELLAEAEHLPCPEKAVMWLRKMISKADEYYEIDDNTRPILLYRGLGLAFLDKFVDELEAALHSCRQIVEVVDMQSGQLPLHNVGCRYKAILGMQTKIFSVMMPDNKTNFHDLITAPKYNMIFEHPIWLREIMGNNPDCYYLLAFDRNYCTFAKRYYKNLRGCIFFAPGGKMPDQDFSGDKKQYDVTFIGSYHNYRQFLPYLYRLKQPYRFLAGKFVRRMVCHPNETAEAVFQSVLDDVGLELDDEEFLDYFSKLRQAFMCVKEYYREKVIRVLLEGGMELHVYGDTWSASPFVGHPYLKQHKDVNMEESLHVMQQSKISMNIMSWHKDGLTERVLNIMANHAVLLSDRSSLLEEEFVDGEDLVLFDLEHIETLPCKIKKLLAEEGRLRQIAENGYQKTIQKHLWINRARQFLSLLGQTPDTP